MYKLFFLRENSPKTAIKEIPISNESTQVLWVKITEKKKKSLVSPYITSIPIQYIKT